MKTPKTIKGYLYLLETIENTKLNELQGFKNLPKEMKDEMIGLSGDISNYLSEIKKYVNK